MKIWQENLPLKRLRGIFADDKGSFWWNSYKKWLGGSLSLRPDRLPMGVIHGRLELPASTCPGDLIWETSHIPTRNATSPTFMPIATRAGQSSCSHKHSESQEGWRFTQKHCKVISGTAHKKSFMDLNIWLSLLLVCIFSTNGSEYSYTHIHPFQQTRKCNLRPVGKHSQHRQSLRFSQDYCGMEAFSRVGGDASDCLRDLSTDFYYVKEEKPSGKWK